MMEVNEELHNNITIYKYNMNKNYIVEQLKKQIEGFQAETKLEKVGKV
ncbi:MAG: hypothetical protein UR82_C0062G0011, partial [Candidatus Moranbacteria bacterium GW2011_GWF1_35_5]